MSALMSGAWREQTTFPTLQKYESERRKDGIWREKVTRGHREFRVTDRELLKKRDDALSDNFGNIITGTRYDTAKMVVERVINLLTPKERNAITPRSKWIAVELLASGKTLEATKHLRETVRCG